MNAPADFTERTFYCAGCDKPIPFDCDDDGRCECGEAMVRLLPKRRRPRAEAAKR